MNWLSRWVYSTNHKDIGTLYIIFGGLSGMIGTGFSVVIRLELSNPGDLFLAGDYQLYNVIITAHAFIMIFLCAVADDVFVHGIIPSGVFRESPVNQLAYLWGETNIGDNSMPVKPQWVRTRNHKNLGWDRTLMVKANASTLFEGRITWPICSRAYSNFVGSDGLEEKLSEPTPTIPSIGMDIDKGGPKRAKIRQTKLTTGLPKGRKVLGDGELIVAAGHTKPHTTGVMTGEREVVQQSSPKVRRNLEMGLERLEEIQKKQQIKDDHHHEPKLKVWDIMLNRETFIAAYESIKGNKGALTPGLDNETLDAFSIEIIDEIITSLKDHTFKFKPIRRIYIPKKNGKLRPLGIPSPKDKIVQKVMSMILEAIYDADTNPIFRSSSHGFRRGRSTHTALETITHTWVSIDYIIEGDIKAYFDTIDNHHILAKLLERYIEDKQFMDLYWKAVGADYIDLTTGKNDYGIIGIPQGGILSPILSNIYLHELDKHIERLEREEREKGINICVDNPKYKVLHTKISNKRQSLKRIKSMTKEKEREYLTEIQELEKARSELPSKNTNYKTFQLHYIRYADDFVIGIRGSKVSAKAIYQNVKDFLRNDLKIELNEEKSLITDPRKGRAKFLGAELRIISSRTFHNKKTTRIYKGGTRKVRVPGNRMIALAPIEKLVKKLEDQGVCKILNLRKRVFIPTRKSAWVNLETQDIIGKYNSVWLGIINYYSFAWNRSQLNLIQFLLHHSAACTLMNKLKINSRKQVFQKFGKNLGVNYKDLKGKDKRIEFKLMSPLVRINKFNTKPAIPFKTFYYNLWTRTLLENYA